MSISRRKRPIIRGLDWLAPIVLAARCFAEEPIDIIIDPCQLCAEGPCPPLIQFSPPPHIPYDSEVLVRMSSPDLPGATIRYTLNGSEPSESDPAFSPDHPIKLNASAGTITARIWYGDSCSRVEAATYAFQVPTPVMTPPAGVISNYTEVSLSCSSTGAVLYYTFESLFTYSTETFDFPFGPQTFLVPIPANPAWTLYTTPIAVTSNSTLSVKAEKPGNVASVICGSYEIAPLPRPVFIPAKGPITNDTSVTITSAVSDATIRYTLDGSEPTTNSLAYSTPFRVDGNTRLKARTFKSGFKDSFTTYTYYRPATNIGLPTRSNVVDYPHLDLTLVSWADRPVCVTHAGDGTHRLFLVEQPGIVRIVGKSVPFLNLLSIPPPLSPCALYDPLNPILFPIIPTEPRRLSAVSLAFPPDYDQKAYFYLSYIAGGTLVVSRFSAVADPDVADPASEVVVKAMPAPDCNGGHLTFDTNGTLWLNTYGPVANATLPGFTENLTALSGKMIPVLNENGHALPTEPVAAFWPFSDHFTSTNCQIVGGVFGQRSVDRLLGSYFYGDRFGRIHALKPDGTNWQSTVLASPVFDTGFPGSTDLEGNYNPDIRPFRISGFGEDESGRLYVINYGASIWWQEPPAMLSVEHVLGGGIYRMDDNLTVFSVRAAGGVNGHPLTLEWFSASARSYQIQRSFNLQDWFNVLDPIVGTGGPLSTQVPSPSPTSGHYYRVNLLPQ